MVYNVMLIGCGHIGREHIQDIYYRENIRISAVIDTDFERARDFSKRYGAKYFGTDYRAAIEEEHIPVDIVIAATYPSTHLDILKVCIRNGLHLLCEKPVAPTLEETEEFIRLARTAPIKVHVGHILRYNDSYRKIKELIDAGTIGSPLVMRFIQNHNCMDWNRYHNLLRDVTPIVDCGIHYFDVMEWMTGSEITRVSAMATKLDTELTPEENDNYCMVHVYLKDGSVAFYETGWSKNLSSANVKEFIGPKGHIKLTYQPYRISSSEEGDLIEVYNSEKREYTNINLKTVYKPMYTQLSGLIECIEKDLSVSEHLDYVYKAAKVAFTAQNSINQHAEDVL